MKLQFKAVGQKRLKHLQEVRLGDRLIGLREDVEAVAADDAGNVFGGYTNTLNLRRWVPKAAPKS